MNSLLAVVARAICLRNVGVKLPSEEIHKGRINEISFAQTRTIQGNGCVVRVDEASPANPARSDFYLPFKAVITVLFHPCSHENGIKFSYCHRPMELASYCNFY